MKKFQSLLRAANRKQAVRSVLKLPLRSYSTDSESSIEDKLKTDPRGAAMDLFLKMFYNVRRSMYDWPVVKDMHISNMLSTIYTNYTDFCAESSFRTEYYSMFVDGENMGPIENLDVDALIAKSVISPFGLGTETGVDENIRKAREISADRITIHSTFLDPFEEIIQKEVRYDGIMTSFGCPTIKLNKLCIYENGGFSKSHVDSMSDDNHVGSAVVVLPTCHKGGELIVRKGKHEVVCSPDQNIRNTVICIRSSQIVNMKSDLLHLDV